MKGATPTKADKQLWDKLAQVGCIACLLDGVQNLHISIHHIAGRTVPGAHQLVLPLCAPHHQHDDTDPMGRIGLHPYKGQFEMKYGSQRELLAYALRRAQELCA